MSPIALISDLGIKDYFVGSMKGTILSINPKAQIVDITHQIPKHDTQKAMFVLSNCTSSFPRETTFVAVIDPGVGTERRCILLRTNNGLNFIGPDNGVFTLIAENFKVEDIREVTNEQLMRHDISDTFHGRDIMAPVAAHLSMGLNLEEVGPKIEGIKTLEIEEAEVTDGEIHGIVLSIDDFGNLVTNIRADLIKEIVAPGEILKISLGEHEFEAPFVKTFGEVPKGKKLCLIGSSNFLEIAKNMGNLKKEIISKRNDELIIKPVRKNLTRESVEGKGGNI